MPGEETDLNELRREFQQKKKELANLRSKLNSINRDKEQIYRELKSFRDKYRSRQERIKVLKKERDEFTKQVKSLKGEREKFNKAVKEKAGKKKEVDQKKLKLLDKANFKGDPSALKRQIEGIETKLETEIMAFSKEQELRKQVKEFKTQLKELEKLGNVWKEINSASVDFSDMRKKAEEKHKNVQVIAEQSQEKHEMINKLYEEVKKFRNEEQPLGEKYSKLKVEYETSKKGVDKLQARVTVLSRLFKDEEEKSFKTKVKEKNAEVQDKLKKGKKLSTEDILAFQATKE